jgi:hypothetical protein
MTAPSEQQISFARAIQRQLNIPNRMIDTHCEAQYGCSFKELDSNRMSKLIDELQRWKSISNSVGYVHEDF